MRTAVLAGEEAEIHLFLWQANPVALFGSGSSILCNILYLWMENGEPGLVFAMARDSPYSAAHLISEAKVNPEKWNAILSDDIIGRTADAIGKRATTVVIVNSGDEALVALKRIILFGVTVMSGSSTTLAEIGFPEFVAEGTSGWNLRKEILSENDEMRRNELKKKISKCRFFRFFSQRHFQHGRNRSLRCEREPGGGMAVCSKPPHYRSRDQQDRPHASSRP